MYYMLLFLNVIEMFEWFLMDMHISKLGYVRIHYEVHSDREACTISSSSPVEPMIFIEESELLRSITFK